ncbi:MAG: glycosyltransferase family 4 protein [Flavobacteriales bacterium]
MRIGINTRLLLPERLDGIGKFTFEVAYRLAALGPEHEYHWFFDRKVVLPREIPSNVVTHVLPPPTRHPFLYYIWFETVLPRALKKHGIERFLSPDGFLSLKSSIPAYPVIHDLNFEQYPEDLPFWTRNFYLRYFPQYARKARQIMTVSEHSRKDIASRYGIDPDRIRVVYNGVDDRFHPLSDTEREKVRNEAAGGTAYLIHVGTLHPRKNIARLLRAFDEEVQKKDRPLKLLLVGKKMWWTRDMENALRRMKDPQKVIMTGHVGDDALNRLLAASEGLLYLSYFEGFGIPVLEAMKAGVPVLCADRTSLPEVGGDAVFYCDPSSESSIREGMDELIKDEEAVKEGVRKGKERAEAFSWERVAEEVKKTIDTDP